MPGIIRPHRWVTQPKYPVAVDKSNPLARGLVNAINFGIGYDAVKGEMATANDAARCVTPAGQGYSTTGGTSIDFDVDAGIGSSIWTVFVLFRPTSWADYQTLFTKGSYEAALLFDASGNVNYSGVGGTANPASVATGFTTGQVHSCTISAPAAGLLPRIYANGRYIGNLSTAAGGSGTTTTIKFGELASGGLSMVGDYIAAHVYSRGLEDGEVVSLHRNPWQVYQPLKRQIWVPVAAAPPTFQAAWARNSNTVIQAAIQ